MTLGESLRAWRTSSGLSLREVADLLRTTISTVHRWETGRQEPTGPASVAIESLISRKGS